MGLTRCMGCWGVIRLRARLAPFPRPPPREPERVILPSAPFLRPGLPPHHVLRSSDPPAPFRSTDPPTLHPPLPASPPASRPAAVKRHGKDAPVQGTLGHPCILRFVFGRRAHPSKSFDPGAQCKGRALLRRIITMALDWTPLLPSSPPGPAAGALGAGRGSERRHRAPWAMSPPSSPSPCCSYVPLGMGRGDGVAVVSQRYRVKTALGEAAAGSSWGSCVHLFAFPRRSFVEEEEERNRWIAGAEKSFRHA